MLKRSMLVLALAAAVLAFLGTGISFAAGSTTGTSIHVHAQVLPSCRATGGTLDFGDYDGTEASGSASISVTCNATGVAFNVALDQGMQMGAGYRQIKNTAGTDALRYQLCNATPCPLSAGTTLEWGDADYAATYIFGNSVSDTSGASPTVMTVHGTLWAYPFNPMVAASSAGNEYADNVIITVHF